MKHINDENIDEIMFQLLEGEISGPEKDQLLEAIQSDEAYSKLWTTWQQTVLSPEKETVSMNIKPLKKKSARIIPLNYKYAIAAMLVLGLGLAVFFLNQKPAGPVVTEGPAPHKAKKPVIEVPKPALSTPAENREDTIIPLREKIRTMAENRNSKSESGDIMPPAEDKKMPAPKNEGIAEVNQPVKNNDPKAINAVQDEEPKDHLLVTMSTDSKLLPDAREKQATPGKKGSLLSRIFGRPEFKLENDSSTRTNRRLIIENKQYKIIAGF
jgi:hypothetical protein